MVEEQRLRETERLGNEPSYGEEENRQTNVLELNLKSDVHLELVLRRIAERLAMEEVFWTQDIDNRRLQGLFNMETGERLECLLSTLQAWGIGERPHTRVMATNCLDAWTLTASALSTRASTSAWDKFVDSVRCRLNVSQVVAQVTRDASLSFDFLVLLISAALLSCVGLVENSFLFMSSSMLISPLMGPVIASVFGTVVNDNRLRWLGLRNEFIGIVLATIIGFVYGGLICAFNCLGGNLTKGLTEEMLSRTDTHMLMVGLVTALTSGAAGAIGVLGDNVGSLVGVAISASLLPPAVNSGLLLALAIGARLLHPAGDLFQSLAQQSQYSSNLAVELFVCASVSMGLTLLNIACIWLMAVLVLRIKEVAPVVRRDEQFWHHDVKVAREHAQHQHPMSINEKLVPFDVETPQYQHTWPRVGRPGSKIQSRLHPNHYHTIHEFHNTNPTFHLPSIMELFSLESDHENRLQSSTCSEFVSCASAPEDSSPSPSCCSFYNHPALDRSITIVPRTAAIENNGRENDC